MPLYIVILKGRKAEKQHEREREKLILDVVKENTKAITDMASKLNKLMIIVNGNMQTENRRENRQT